MHGLFALYLLTFVPITGKDIPAKITARDAALIQVGAKEDWDMVTQAVDRRIPAKVKELGSIYGVMYNKEVKFKVKKFDVHITEQRSAVVYTVNF
jgi:hypothetical protein